MISFFTILPKNQKYPKEKGHLQTHEQANRIPAYINVESCQKRSHIFHHNLHKLYVPVKKIHYMYNILLYVKQ